MLKLDEVNFKIITDALLKHKKEIKELYNIGFNAQLLTNILTGSGTNGDLIISSFIKKCNLLKELILNKNLTPVVIVRFLLP